jgi:hypothetical protein
MPHARLPLPIKTCLYKVLISIDYSKPKLQAVKIERQELLPGPEGVAVCTWADGSTYKSGIANLQLESRAPAKVIPPKPKAKGKVKARGKDKTKRKAKAKGRPRKGAALPAEEELPDAAAEDLPLYKPWAMAARIDMCTHWHIIVIHCSCTLIA